MQKGCDYSCCLPELLIAAGAVDVVAMFAAATTEGAALACAALVA